MQCMCEHGLRAIRAKTHTLLTPYPPFYPFHLSFSSTLTGVIGRCRSHQSNFSSLTLRFFGDDRRGQSVLTAPTAPINQFFQILFFFIHFDVEQRDQPMLTALIIFFIPYSLSLLLCVDLRDSPKRAALFHHLHHILILSFLLLLFQLILHDLAIQIVLFIQYSSISLLLSSAP